MACQKPREEEEFLAQRPVWLRKVLQGDFALTPDELAEMTQSNFPEVLGQAQDAYVELLNRYPERFREYRKVQKKLGAQSALHGLPPVPPGAPRKDALAQEAAELQRAGQSYAKIARTLNRKHGPETTTPEAVRKLIGSRKSGKTPEKT